MNVAHVNAVFRKETIDNLRDRRTLLSSFGLSVLSPLLFVALMVFVLNQAVGRGDSQPEIDVQGAAHAPALVAWLRAQGAVLEEVDLEDPRAAVAAGDHGVILVIPADYAVNANRGSAQLQVVYDSSKFGDASRHYSQLRRYLDAYSGMVGRLRLMARGVSPDVVRALDVQAVDTATPGARALSVLATFPYLLVLVIFVSGFHLAVDTTAGERDHGSLEPLLTAPLDRPSLVLGKLAATSFFSLLGLLVFLIIFALAMPFVPFHRVGMALSYGPGEVAMSLLICLPLVLLAAALLMVVASFAKSFKEAQTYLSAVIFVPTMPLVITGIMGVDPSTPLMLIPSLSQSLLVSELLSGGSLRPVWLALSGLTTLALAGLLYLLAVRLYRSERLLV